MVIVIISKNYRLTPPVMALLVFTMFIIPHMGSGPRWEQSSTPLLTNNNQEKWWAFLLYINNYVEPGSFVSILM